MWCSLEGPTTTLEERPLEETGSPRSLGERLLKPEGISTKGKTMKRFGADVMAVAAIVTGAAVSGGASMLLADSRGEEETRERQAQAVEVRDARHVRVEIRRVRQTADLARERAERARARAERARERAAEVRARAEVSRARAAEARAGALVLRERVRRAAREQVAREQARQERRDPEFDFDFDFQFDFDYDFEAGELRMELQGLEGLGSLRGLEALEALEGLEGLEGLEALDGLRLSLDLSGLESLDDLEWQLQDLDVRLEGLDGEISRELELRLEGELRRLEEELARARVEVRGR